MAFKSAELAITFMLVATLAVEGNASGNAPESTGFKIRPGRGFSFNKHAESIRWRDGFVEVKASRRGQDRFRTKLVFTKKDGTSIVLLESEDIGMLAIQPNGSLSAMKYSPATGAMLVPYVVKTWANPRKRPHIRHGLQAVW